MNKPRFVILLNRLEEYRSYMRDYALICKFVGYWPAEKDMLTWIQQRWKPKGHVELKLGAKGFFTVIFSNLEDRERIFEEGPYFMNNAGLFMRDWVDCYNPEKESMLAAPIWIRLFGLPTEFWDPEILKGIGNTIGSFVKVAESTKRGRYTTYARICAYMNITEPLLDSIELEYHDEIWNQPIDYEHIPFRCRRCHEYGHLYRECPITLAEKEREVENERRKATKKTGEKEEDFREVQRRKKRGNSKIQTGKQKGTHSIETQNKFQILQDEEAETEANGEEGTEGMEVIKENAEKEINEINNDQERVESPPENQEDQREMEIDSQKTKGEEEEQVMAKLLQEWKRLDERFIPEDQK